MEKKMHKSDFEHKQRVENFERNVKELNVINKDAYFVTIFF